LFQRHLSVLIVLGGLSLCSAAMGQEQSVDRSARLLLNSEIGSATQLGYKFPSTSFGPSVEIPLTKHFELQGDAAYSPDRKFITNDGHAFRVSGTFIHWARPSVGLVAGFERTWLWTSQFNKTAFFPSAGVVVRSGYLGPGRLYLTYQLPTGCVWATASNPCKTQSNRLQGLQVRQEFRAVPHLRLGVGGGLYHFCDQGNPYAPQVGRTCHMAVTVFTMGTFESHLRRNLGSKASYDSEY
jgi:hypothetical protein